MFPELSIQRNYFKGLPQGTRNPPARDGDIWNDPSHTPACLHLMNRHPPGTTKVDYRLETPDIHSDVNANLDSTNWRKCNLPDSLAWIRSNSITGYDESTKNP